MADQQLTSMLTRSTCALSLRAHPQILDAIEANDYDNFSRRAYVPKSKKLVSLPTALMRALLPRHR